MVTTPLRKNPPVDATRVTRKLAAVKALAELTRSTVPDIVNMAYNEQNIGFGPNYIIPKPLDPRLLETVAPAVAKAAIASGVAQKTIADWDDYALQLNKRLGLDNQLMRAIGNKARKDPKRVVFVDGENIKDRGGLAATLGTGDVEVIMLPMLGGG